MLFLRLIVIVVSCSLNGGVATYHISKATAIEPELVDMLRFAGSTLLKGIM